jgi:hypothetical protein
MSVKTTTVGGESIFQNRFVNVLLAGLDEHMNGKPQAIWLSFQGPSCEYGNSYWGLLYFTEIWNDMAVISGRKKNISIITDR